MKISINLIKKPLIIMFLVFCCVESIIAFLFLFLYQNSLQTNQTLINENYMKNTKEFVNSFSFLIISKLLETKKYLLLFQKHMSILDERILKEKYYNSFQNCILNQISDNNEFNYKGDIVEYLKEEKKFLLKNKELIVELRNLEFLNKISTFNNLNNDQMYNEICYALIFLKTWEINNLLELKEKQIILNYTIYYDNKIFIYPPKKINEEIYKSTPFSFINNSQQKNLFYQFEMINFNLLLNLCTNFKLNDNSKIICSTLNMSRLLEKTFFNSTYFINNLIYSKNDYLNLSFSSNKYLFNEAYNLFNHKDYGDYQIFSKKQIPCLFHSIYFDLVKNINLKSKKKKLLVEEYNENIKSLHNFLENSNEENLFFNFSVNQHYIHYKYNNKGEKVYYKKYGKIKKGKFLFYIKKITDIFDNENYNTNNNILFYSIIILKENDDNINYEIISIFYLKYIRNYIFFITIILLSTIIIFIILKFIINIILNPINQFKKNIENLIEQFSKNDNIQFKNNTNNTCINNENTINTLSKVSRIKSIIKNIISKSFTHYTNYEIKEIENEISFFQKILLTKNKSTPYQNKAEFYESISSEIPKELTLEIFNCQIIIGNNYIQNKNYMKGKNELENLEKKINEYQKLIISKSNDNDINMRNLSKFYGIYMNDYSNFNFNSYIYLQQISQNCHFLIGICYYFLFKQLKRNIKKNNILKKQTIEQLDFYLINSINHFKICYKINNCLHINFIKNIIILIYLSKCYYSFSNRQIEETNKKLKKSFIILSKFNELIINLINNSKCKINSRIMLIINGNLIEYILYNIGKFAFKTGKMKIAYFTFFNILHLSYFENENLHLKCLKWINKINQIFKKDIFEIELKRQNTKKKKRKTTYKNLKKDYKPLFIEEKQFDKNNFISKSSIDFLKEYINNFLLKNEILLLQNNNDKKILYDMINLFENLNFENNLILKEKFKNLTKSFINKSLNINILLNSVISISQFEKTYFLIDKMFKRKKKYERKIIILIISETFLNNLISMKSFSLFLISCLSKFLEEKDKIGFLFSVNEGIKIKIDIKEKKYNLKKIEEELNKLNIRINNNNFNFTDSFDEAIEMLKNFYQENLEEKYSFYIYSFSQIKDLRYKTKEKSKFQINQINYLKISMYFFVLNNLENINNKIQHYLNYTNKFIEGVMILINNFKIIKLGFSNLTFGKKQKNTLSYDVDIIKNII